MKKIIILSLLMVTFFSCKVKENKNEQKVDVQYGVSEPKHHDEHWTYSGENGPAHWSHIK